MHEHQRVAAQNHPRHASKPGSKGEIKPTILSPPHHTTPSPGMLLEEMPCGLLPDTCSRGYPAGAINMVQLAVADTPSWPACCMAHASNLPPHACSHSHFHSHNHTPTCTHAHAHSLCRECRPCKRAATCLCTWVITPGVVPQGLWEGAVGGNRHTL